MSKQYATYHAEKGSISSGGIGNHIDRKIGAEHTYRHADKERTHLNKNILVNEHCSKKLHLAISDRIAQGYKAKNKAGELKAIRKDAVKYTTHILTGSHEQMKKIETNPNLRKDWIISNLEFMQKEYGKENIVRFSVHRDERTMHIHCVCVPLTSDGRLSAKEVLGGRKELSERQDRYALAMEKFGLERGEKATGIQHENARDYYSRIQKALDEGNEQTLIKPQKTIFGINIGVDKEKIIKSLESKISAQKTTIKALVLEREIEIKNKKELTEKNTYIQKQKENLFYRIKNTEKKTNELIKSLVLSDEKAKNLREDLKKKSMSQLYSTIENSTEIISIHKMDELIRTSMRELNPTENPWTTLQNHFGDKAEREIQNKVSQKNLEIEKMKSLVKIQEAKKQKEKEQEQPKENLEVRKVRRR